MVLPGQYVGQTLRLDQPDSVGGEIIAISDISLGTQEKTVPPRTARRQTSFFADCRMGLRQKARRRLESVAGMTTEVPHIISSSIIALDSFSSLSTDWANAFPEPRKRVAIKTDFAMFVRWHLVSNRSTVSPPMLPILHGESMATRPTQPQGLPT